MAGSLKTVAHAALSPCGLIQVWMHILGDPQSVQLRNAKTTTTILATMVILIEQKSERWLNVYYQREKHKCAFTVQMYDIVVSNIRTKLQTNS